MTRVEEYERFSTTERDQDLGIRNLRLLDCSTNRFVIQVSCFARILIFLISFPLASSGAVTQTPVSAQKFTVTIEHSIRLICTSSYPIQWTHQQIRIVQPSDVYVDGIGMISAYKMIGRHSIETGTKNLLVTRMTTEDAGIYSCAAKETGEDIAVFNLAVAVSKLECSMNPNWNDIVGENDCGIHPDIIRFNCTVKYHGNFGPTLQWRNSGQRDVIKNEVETSTAHGYSTSVLSVPARFALNGTQFVCRVNESQLNDNQLTWRSPHLKIQYFFNYSQTVKASQGDEIHCSANSSQSCDYQWINDQQRHSSIIKDSIFKPREDVIRQGIYYCRAGCRIRDKICVAIPLRTEHKMSGKSGYDPHLGFIIMSVISSITLTCFVIVSILLCKLHRKHHLIAIRSMLESRVLAEPESEILEERTIHRPRTSMM